MNARSWLTAVYDSSLVISLIVDVVVLYCVIPAYRRTKHIGFLLLMFSYLLSILGTTSDHTIGRWHMVQQQYVVYRTARWFTHWALNILLAAGIVTLARSYLSFTRSPGEPSDSSNQALERTADRS